jgi:hypothetical protein
MFIRIAYLRRHFPLPPALGMVVWRLADDPAMAASRRSKSSWRCIRHGGASRIELSVPPVTPGVLADAGSRPRRVADRFRRLDARRQILAP